ncbi:MAG: universal stress protein [Desulfocapsaceae bacterium]
MKISKILLPVDGSIYSDNAVEHAVYLADLCDAHVTAVCCYEWLGGLTEINGSMVEELKGKLRLQAESVLETAGRMLADSGIRYDTRPLSGAPGTMLSNLAKSKEFDLIIMGSHGHSDIAGLFLGSVTHKVLNTIYCPILVVPERD